MSGPVSLLDGPALASEVFGPVSSLDGPFSEPLALFGPVSSLDGPALALALFGPVSSLDGPVLASTSTSGSAAAALPLSCLVSSLTSWAEVAPALFALMMVLNFRCLARRRALTVSLSLWPQRCALGRRRPRQTVCNKVNAPCFVHI